MKKEEKKYITPDWVPENAGENFAVKFVKGVNPNEVKNKTGHKKPVKSSISANDYINGVLNNNRTMLGKAITLIESNSPSHQEIAREVLNKLLPYSGNSLRIGISGVPGAGKSTFIETFGMMLISQGYKVAVLTVDPSSSVGKGSILGDKTRMEKLSREENCFIRPSPSGGTLGGVTRKSRETISVCEAAGYNIILIETVGVGQSEITVRSMVDFFLLVQIPLAGDELQGIKKGVIEIADMIAINKAEDKNMHLAEIAKTEFSGALNYLTPATPGWKPLVMLCSAFTGFGVEDIWKKILEFEVITKSSGYFDERRKNQMTEWLYALLNESLVSGFYGNKTLQKELNLYKEKIQNNLLAPYDAVEQLMESYKNILRQK